MEEEEEESVVHAEEPFALSSHSHATVIFHGSPLRRQTSTSVTTYSLLPERTIGIETLSDHRHFRLLQTKTKMHFY